MIARDTLRAHARNLSRFPLVLLHKCYRHIFFVQTIDQILPFSLVFFIFIFFVSASSHARTGAFPLLGTLSMAEALQDPGYSEVAEGLKDRLIALVRDYIDLGVINAQELLYIAVLIHCF